MPATLPRRAAVVTAVAATAFGGVALAGSSTAGAATPKTPTSLSAGPNNQTINPGGGAQITGELHSTKRVNNRSVKLLAKPTGTTGWTREQTNKTDKKGLVHFQVVPASTTSYKLKFKSTKNMQASRSTPVTVTVADTTSLTISAATQYVSPGESDTISGVLSYHGTPIANATVDLQQQTAKGSSQAQTGTTDSTGTVSFSVTPNQKKTTYALVFHKTATNAGARSASVMVHLRYNSTLNISVKSKANANQYVIRGELTGDNQVLGNRQVKLEQRKSVGGKWSKAAVAKTDGAGNVKFSEHARKHSEDYKLVFEGGQAFNASHSGVVTVPAR